MAETNLRVDEGEAVALARLLDPVALEARLAEARIRRAGALAAREAPPAEPVLENLPGLALRGACVILAGLTVVATVATWIFARPGVAPEAIEIAAVLDPPAALSSTPPATMAAWQEASFVPPLLAALAPSGPLARPAADRDPAVAVAVAAAPSRARARAPGPAGFAEASAVLRRASAAAFLPMMSRSAGPTRYPVAANDTREPVRRSGPKQVRQPDSLVGQITRVGRAVVRDITRDVKRTDAGKGVVRGVRRAAAVLNDKSRATVREARPGVTKSTRSHRSSPDRRGPGKVGLGPKAKSAGPGRGKGSGKGKSSGKGSGKSSGKGSGKGKGARR